MNFCNVDLSLDIERQLDGALVLLKSGLSRVLTLGVGASNGSNQVDGFGWFDSHQGVCHADPETENLAKSARHHVNLERVMSALGQFIDTLKKTDSRVPGKSLFEVTTVVLSVRCGYGFFDSAAVVSGCDADDYGCGWLWR